MQSHKIYVGKLFSFFLPKIVRYSPEMLQNMLKYLHFCVLTSVGFGGNESQPIIRTVRPYWEFQRTTANAVADSLWLFSLLENKWSESYLNMTQIFAWIRRIGKEVWLKYADLNLKILQFHSDILEPARIRTNNAG